MGFILFPFFFFKNFFTFQGNFFSIALQMNAYTKNEEDLVVFMLKCSLKVLDS